MRSDIIVKEGVILRPAHFLPHMIRAIMVALDTQPKTTDHQLVITDAWREDDLASFSLHPFCAAFDFRCKNLAARSETERLQVAQQWARNMGELLKEDYQVLAHGHEGGNMDNLHIHVEFDPR